MKILLTGGSGLLGSNFISSYKEKFEIHLITRKKLEHQVPQYYVDLSKPWETEILPKKMDVVVMLAQERRYKDFPASSEDIFMVNVYATIKLLNYARMTGVEKVIFASTGGIYQQQSSFLKEESPLRINSELSMYYNSKIAGEGIISTYQDYFDTIVMRPFFIYGKEQNESSLFSNLLNRISNEVPVYLEGERGIRLNPIYVEDAAAALAVLVEAPVRGIYNVAGKEVTDIRSIAEVIGGFLEKKPIFNIGDQNHDYLADTSKLVALMQNYGWLTVREGIQKWLS